VSQPDPTGESPVTTAKPPARYGAICGRACGRLCSTELHHHWGHDRSPFTRRNFLHRINVGADTNMRILGIVVLV